MLADDFDLKPICKVYRIMKSDLENIFECMIENATSYLVHVYIVDVDNRLILHYDIDHLHEDDAEIFYDRLPWRLDPDADRWDDNFNLLLQALFNTATSAEYYSPEYSTDQSNEFRIEIRVGRES